MQGTEIGRRPGKGVYPVGIRGEQGGVESVV